MRAILITLGIMAIMPLTVTSSVAAMAVNDLSMKLRTNTAGGYCVSYLDEEHGTLFTSCYPEAIDEAEVVAEGNTLYGCTHASYKGQCVYGSFPNNVYTTLHAECPSGQVFSITTGNSAGDSHCDLVTSSYGAVTGAHCGNGSGVQEYNLTNVDCLANGGAGACQTSGSGTAACVIVLACADPYDGGDNTLGTCNTQCRSYQTCTNCCIARLDAETDACVPDWNPLRMIRCLNTVRRAHTMCEVGCAGKPDLPRPPT